MACIVMACIVMAYIIAWHTDNAAPLRLEPFGMDLKLENKITHDCEPSVHSHQLNDGARGRCIKLSQLQPANPQADVEPQDLEFDGRGADISDISVLTVRPYLLALIGPVRTRVCQVG